MSIAQAFLAEYDQEAKTTRKFLERVPQDKLAWKCHDKSMSIGQLALHMATAPGAIIEMAAKDAAPIPDFSAGRPAPTSIAEILAAFDHSTQAVRKLLPTMDDAKMHAMWSGQAGGKTVVSMPRVVFIRSVLLNHIYHHRGQLGVYLRLLGAKVPSAYGPSGDELPDFA
jgi:uncharacterized damage-inducible protein DinB